MNTPSRRASVLLPVDLDQRARLVDGTGEPSPSSLAPLADSLARDLEPLLARELPIPSFKARLTRTGGRCPVHGGLLVFDPWLPHDHRCERCAHDYRGRDHDEWWAMGAQLWTVERAVHAATLFALRGDPRHSHLASEVLRTIATRYESWPNRDNVLGPTRPFFSTYLESIWLLNACHALALLEAASAPGVDTLGGMVRDRLIEPSARLIASYHEGTSNRQVWNEVAILSALRLLDDRAAIDERLAMRGGLPWLMKHGLLADGSWYEGENYHLFAHRGLWYGVQLLRALDAPLQASLAARFREGFFTPFVGLLPDDTFPSRRDSQYAVSMRQWRIAEWCELGYAESKRVGAADPRLAGILTRLYDGTAPSRETQRWRSTADAERNAPPARLTRADLSWRALLAADEAPPPAAPWVQGSGCLPAQGLAVIRRDSARTYVALEGGHSGGGHGHPDRLALTLQSDDARWLQDPGAGSYTDRSLHWYRSTLAHAAPLVNGRSQQAMAGELLAFEDRGGAGWIWKRARDIVPGVSIDRTIVVADGYLVDLLEWSSVDPTISADPEIMLPITARATVVPAPDWLPTELHGAGGVEDGFEFVRSTEVAPLVPRVMLEAQSVSAQDAPSEQSAGAASGRAASVWYASSAPGVLLRGAVPGAPERSSDERHWLRVHGRSGVIAGVWCWPAPSSAPVSNAHSHAGALTVSAVHFELGDTPTISVTTSDGTLAEHSRAPHGWHVALTAAHARSSIDLEGLVPRLRPVAVTEGKAASGDAAVLVPTLPDSAIGAHPGEEIPGAQHFSLEAAHYVRTEETWEDAGAPTADVQIAATAAELVVDVVIRTGPLVCDAEPRENPLDNEHADINGDGLQWYLGAHADADWVAAGLIVPAHPDQPRVTPLVPGQEIEPTVRWRPTADGWAIRLAWRRETLPRARDGTVRFDLVVNERPSGRERRRGQLVLSGGGGFGYLRGDRHEPARALRLSLT